jgi:hypothetical protein
MSAALTYWRALSEPVGQRVPLSSPRVLFKRFAATPTIATSKESLAGWSPATFRADRRALANVEQCFAICLDIEKGGTFDGACEALGNFWAFVHTTYSHRPDAHRLRVIVPTSRAITGDEYRRGWRWFADAATSAGLTVDSAASDPSRLWFVPAIAPGAEYLSRELTGEVLDVDTVLRLTMPKPIARPKPTDYAASPLAHRIERARRYLLRVEPAVSGQGGHTQTFVIAEKMVRGFELPEAVAFDLLWTIWNPSCAPPWSKRDLLRKIHEAARAGRFEPASLLNAQRGTSCG